jgi:hypothetical protein
MNEPLRPLNLGEILDRTAEFYRRRFLVFFGIAALPSGVVLAIASGTLLVLLWFGANGQGVGSRAAAGIVALAFFGALLLLALPAVLGSGALGTAALNYAADRAHRGEPIAILASYKQAWKQGWRYLWLYVLVGLIAVGVPLALWGGALFSAGIAGTLGWGTADTLLGLAGILGGIGFAVYYMLALVRLWLGFPACVVEQTGAWSAIKRGNLLSKGTKGRLLVLWLMGAVLQRLLTMVLAVPLMIAVELVPGASTPQHQQTAGMVILFILFAAFFAVQALTRPVYSIALLLFYYDQRIRQEGYDIERMMQQAGMVAEPPPLPEAAPWLAPVPLRTPRETPLDHAAPVPAASVSPASFPADLAEADALRPAFPEFQSPSASEPVPPAAGEHA